MENFSKNQKLNVVLNNIYDSLLSIHDTENESIEEIRHYAKEFPRETDFNLYQYGNVLIYDDEIKELYLSYSSLKKASIEKIICIYKRQIRYIANHILKK